MENIKLSIDKAFGFVSEQNVAGYKAQVAEASVALQNGTVKGSDFLGWLHLPSSIDEAHLSDLEATAKTLRENCEVVVVIGIGEVIWEPERSSMHSQTASTGYKPNANRPSWFMPDKTSEKIICTSCRNC